jgi:hypothetical protein
MNNLEEALKDEIAKRGENSRWAQMLRNQIAAEKSGKSLRDLYVTGSVKKPVEDNKNTKKQP